MLEKAYGEYIDLKKGNLWETASILILVLYGTQKLSWHKIFLISQFT